MADSLLGLFVAGNLLKGLVVLVIAIMVYLGVAFLTASRIQMRNIQVPLTLIRWNARR